MKKILASAIIIGKENNVTAHSCNLSSGVLKCSSFEKGFKRVIYEMS